MYAIHSSFRDCPFVAEKNKINSILLSLSKYRQHNEEKKRIFLHLTRSVTEPAPQYSMTSCKNQIKSYYTLSSIKMYIMSKKINPLRKSRVEPIEGCVG